MPHTIHARRLTAAFSAMALTGALLALLALSCAARPLAAIPAALSVAPVLTAPGDSVYFTVRWTVVPAADGRGPIEGFRITATRTSPTAGTPVVVNVAATVSTADVRVPVNLQVGQTASGTVCVAAVRRAQLSAQTCVPWTTTFADAPPPAPTGVTLDTVRLSAAQPTDSVTLLVEVPGRRLREVVASGACNTAGPACLAALAGSGAGGRDTLRPGCGARTPTNAGRRIYAVADPDTLSQLWLDCGALAVRYGGTRQVAVNALRSLGFNYQ